MNANHSKARPSKAGTRHYSTSSYLESLAAHQEGRPRLTALSDGLGREGVAMHARPEGAVHAKPAPASTRGDTTTLQNKNRPNPGVLLRFKSIHGNIPGGYPEYLDLLRGDCLTVAVMAHSTMPVARKRAVTFCESLKEGLGDIIIV